MAPDPVDRALQGGHVQAVHESAQFELQMPEASLHVRQFKLRALVSWNHHRQMFDAKRRQTKAR
eukprot:2368156-Alexandrium_andersonii.AAC.1